MSCSGRRRELPACVHGAGSHVPAVDEAARARFSRSEERAWRALVDAAADPRTGAEKLLQRVRETAGKAILCPSRRDQAAFAALQALARAWGEAARDRRARLSDGLATLAEECSAAAGWSRHGASDAVLAEPGTWTEPDLFEVGGTA